jgi:hypothetical protein
MKASLLIVLIGLSPAASAAMAGGGGAVGAGPGVQGQDGNQTWQPAAPPSLVATVFDVVVSDGQRKTLARLAFHAKDVTSDYFGHWHLESIPFSERVSAAGNAVSATGTLSDSAGNSLTLDATASGDAIEGTIVTLRKGGDRHEITFKGGTLGSAAAKAAATEAEQAATGKRH